MSISQIASLSQTSALAGLQAPGTAPTGPRALDPGCAQQFRELCQTEPAASASANAQAAAADRPGALDMDIERVVMSNLPPADASPAEFALGMLRAQVKVAQAAVGIELAAKTTQSLTQGVQTLTTRS